MDDAGRRTHALDKLQGGQRESGETKVIVGVISSRGRVLIEAGAIEESRVVDEIVANAAQDSSVLDTGESKAGPKRDRNAAPRFHPPPFRSSPVAREQHIDLKSQLHQRLR